MKKALIALLVIGFASTLCFAQGSITEKAVVKPVTELTEDTAELIGKIVSVVTPDPQKGIGEGTVKVVDDVGKVSTLGVTSTTEVLDAALNVITLNQLKKDDKVKVKYSQDGGKAEAESISVTK